MKKQSLLLCVLALSSAYDLQAAAALAAAPECLVALRPRINQMTENLFTVALENPSNGAVITDLLGRGAQVFNAAGTSVLQNLFAGIIKSRASVEGLAASLVLHFQAGANPFDGTAILQRDGQRISFYQVLQERYRQAAAEQNIAEREKYAALMEITAIWALQNRCTLEVIAQVSDTVLFNARMQEPERSTFINAIAPLLKAAINHAEVKNLVAQIENRMKLEAGDLQFRSIIEAGQLPMVLEGTKQTIRENITRLMGGAFDRELMRSRIWLAAFLDNLVLSDDELDRIIRHIEERILPGYGAAAAPVVAASAVGDDSSYYNSYCSIS